MTNEQDKGFTYTEQKIGRALFNKLYPEDKNKQRRRSPDFDEIINTLTKEEVNSDYLSMIVDGWPVDFILNHPDFVPETATKAAYQLTQIEAAGRNWCEAMNTLFMHGAKNPYDPKDKSPLNMGMPKRVASGELLAPMPQDPKVAIAFLQATQKALEENSKSTALSRKNVGL